MIPQVAIDLTSDGESDEGPLVQFSSETDELVKLDHFSVHTARQQQRNLAVIAPNTFYQQRLSVPTDTASSRSLNNKSDNGSLDPVRSNETTISSFSSLRGE